MKMPDPASFQPFPDESHLPAGTAPTQLYNMLKAAHDHSDFTVDAFAEALAEYDAAIQCMRDMTKPPDRERRIVLDIAQGAEAYRAAKASLMSVQTALRQTLPPNRARETVLDITPVSKPYQSFKAALQAAQEALAGIEVCLSRLLDMHLGNYCFFGIVEYPDMYEEDD